MKLKRTTSTDPDFIYLVTLLDEELHAKYGTVQAAYDQHNVIKPIETVLVGYVEEEPVACGCFKKIDEATVEMKRFLVKKEFRGQGFSRMLLEGLEDWAKSLGYSRSRLETGRGQAEAIGLYRNSGYERIENFGPYLGMEHSLCFGKQLK